MRHDYRREHFGQEPLRIHTHPNPGFWLIVGLGSLFGIGVFVGTYVLVSWLW